MMLSKQNEIDSLAEIVGLLPEGGYLASIFRTIEPSIVTAIRNDFGFIDWSARVDEQRQHREQVAGLVADKVKLTAEIRDLERQRRHLGAELEEIRAAIRVLARTAGEKP